MDTRLIRLEGVVKKALCLFLVLAGIFLLSCKKQSTSPSTVSGTINCSTSYSGTWNLYNAASTTLTFLDSNSNSNASFSATTGTYKLTFVPYSSAICQSDPFSVVIGKTTTASCDGVTITTSGPS